jgi:formate hydrogenlyase transcriptional activator
MCPFGATKVALNYQRYANVLAMAEVVSFRDEPGDLLRDLAPRLHEIIPFDRVSFSLCDSARQSMRVYAWDGAQWTGEPTEVAIEEAGAGWVWQYQSPLVINDLLRDDLLKDDLLKSDLLKNDLLKNDLVNDDSLTQDLLQEDRLVNALRRLRDRKFRSCFALPLTTAHEKLGVIGFASKRPHAFGPRDVHFLQRVAGMVALCLDHSLAEAALSLAPLVSAKGPLKALHVPGLEDEFFSPRDVELLQQVAAILIPRLERTAQRSLSQAEQTQSASELHTRPGAAAVVAQATRPGWLDQPEAPSECEHLRAVYSDVSQVGLCILGADFRYRTVNPTLAKMNGVPREAHLGKTVHEVLGEYGAIVEHYLRRVLATGQSVLNAEAVGRKKGRTEPGYWMGHYIPIKDASGRVAEIGVVVLEVTEQRKLEESLRHVSENLRSEKKRAEVMTEVGRLLAAKSDIREVFLPVSAYLRRVLRQEYASLSLRDEKSGRLIQKAIDFPLRKSSSDTLDTSAANEPAERALRQGAPLILDKKDLERLDSASADHLLREGLQSLCCVPLVRPKNSLGVLLLGSTRANAFKPDDLTLLNQVAGQLATALENDATAREVERLRSRLGRERGFLQGDSRTHVQFEGIIGESSSLQTVMEQVSVVADSDVTVLLLGETGTGKGLVARALHQSSNRKDRPFIILNCAAIPTGLLESELFGHERGAFTGAVRQKIGRLELADEGTLFLDEIGEISPELQPKLLRVLQDHEFERLGGIRTIKVDLRLITATNRDLARSVANKEFRSDLFYRLNVFPIRLPPLRERPEDIPVLVRYFVNKFAARMDRKIETVPSETMDALVSWEWPGNVRELENFIERSVILTEGTALRVPLSELEGGKPGAAARSLENAEREHIIRVLRQSGGMISGPKGAARRLEVKRTTLQSKMTRLGIEREDYSPSADD